MIRATTTSSSPTTEASLPNSSGASACYPARICVWWSRPQGPRVRRWPGRFLISPTSPGKTSSERTCWPGLCSCVKVVADSHAIVWYLQGSERLSAVAEQALIESEMTEGVVISVATLIDLWYSSSSAARLALDQGNRRPSRVGSIPATSRGPQVKREHRWKCASPHGAVADFLRPLTRPSCPLDSFPMNVRGRRKLRSQPVVVAGHTPSPITRAFAE